MTRIVTLTITALFIIALSACAPPQKAPVHVKCPACGYEFDVPQE